MARTDLAFLAALLLVLVIRSLVLVIRSLVLVLRRGCLVRSLRSSEVAIGSEETSSVASSIEESRRIQHGMKRIAFK